MDQVRMESNRFEREGRLIAVGKAVNLPQGAYTTLQIALERDNIDLMRTAQGRAAAIGNPDQIRGWASERRLPSDQARVAELTLLTSIQGRASAAKATTVGAIREFVEGQGYAVVWVRPDDSRGQAPFPR